MCDYLIADKGHTRIVVESMAEEDVQEIVRSPRCWWAPMHLACALWDDRAGQAAPALLRHLPARARTHVRDLDCPLPQGVYKMTGGSAAALGLVDRGLLRKGYRAASPSSIRRPSRTGPPTRSAPVCRGIGTVIVNGVIVIDGGEHTGALPGRVLRHEPTGSELGSDK